MNRTLRVTVAAGIMTAVMAGVTYAANRPIPANEPQKTIQNITGSALPGNADALQKALAAAGHVQYKILVVDTIDGEDRTAYLDRVAEQWGQPAADTLLLVIYGDGNYDIRFYMGAIFRQHDVSVAEMLGLVRTRYAPKARSGNAAGGLADLVGAVNLRIGGGVAAETNQPQPAGTTADITVPDPFAGGGRQTAVGQLEIGKGLLTGYLTQFKVGSAGGHRLTDFRFDDNKLNPVESAENKIVFQVTFDVLPATADGASWLAGNGQAGEGGWIVGKSLFLTAVREGNVWKLVSLGTGR